LRISGVTQLRSRVKPVVDFAGIVKKVGNSRKRVEQALGRKK
jgi:hypothetical protein